MREDHFRRRMREALREHWLTGVRCDPVEKTDTATCFCAVWTSGPRSSVVAAVSAWVEHVIEQVKP